MGRRHEQSRISTDLKEIVANRSGRLLNLSEGATQSVMSLAWQAMFHSILHFRLSDGRSLMSGLINLAAVGRTIMRAGMDRD